MAGLARFDQLPLAHPSSFTTFTSTSNPLPTSFWPSNPSSIIVSTPTTTFSDLGYTSTSPESQHPWSYQLAKTPSAISVPSEQSTHSVASSSSSLDKPTSFQGIVLSKWKSLASYRAQNTIGNASDTCETGEDVHWHPKQLLWLSTQARRWLSVCGKVLPDKQGMATSLSHAGQQRHNVQPHLASLGEDPASYWTTGKERPGNWSDEERAIREIPQYVFDYAPYVRLFSGEEFWPCDIAEHLSHTSPYQNYTPIRRKNHTLDNLDRLNKLGRFVYLHSNDNVERRPTWLGGSKNIPGDSDSQETGTQGRPHADQALHQPGGHSSAPAILVVVPKENGIVDAFWFYFYSYNLGNVVLNVRFGDHVGDWEHSVVRFQNGTPQTVFLSEHSVGEAYSYGAMEKIGKRPVIYSATGTHAMYATPGLHAYALPWGLLHDQTDRGPLWDPLLNLHGFVYNDTTRVLKSSTQTPQAPVHWFYYNGRWGDKIYPMSDSRQYKFAGEYHYVSGPLGPQFKNLGRRSVCQSNQKCIIKHWLGGGRVRQWPDMGTGEETEQADRIDTPGPSEL